VRFTHRTASPVWRCAATKSVRFIFHSWLLLAVYILGWRSEFWSVTSHSRNSPCARLGPLSSATDEFFAHKDAINCAALAKWTATVFATGGDDCVIHLWRLMKSQPVLVRRRRRRACFVCSVCQVPAAVSDLKYHILLL
jgi:hypothetical protein